MEPVANQALAELRCLAAALRKRHGSTINKVERPLLLRDTAFMLWQNHTKEIQLLLRPLARILRNYPAATVHLSNRSTFTKIPAQIRDDDMSTENDVRAKEDPHKAAFHGCTFSVFRNVWAHSPLRTALPV